MPRPTRRHLIATAGALPLAVFATAVPAVAAAAADADAALLARCTAYLDGYAALNRKIVENGRLHGADVPDAAYAAYAAALDDLADIVIEIGEQVAVTSAGHAARARVLWTSLGSTRAPGPGDEDWLLWALVRDLAQLDGRPA